MHCPSCKQVWEGPSETFTGMQAVYSCPGVTCPQCTEKDAEIAKAHEALDGANVARGMAGHSLRYRIGLLKADQDEETALADRHSRLREEAETRCGLLQEEIARLRDFAAGKGMVSEAADMGEVAVLVVGLHAEIARLRALVAVGREMATCLDTVGLVEHPWRRALVEKWRALEGK